MAVVPRALVAVAASLLAGCASSFVELPAPTAADGVAASASPSVVAVLHPVDALRVVVSRVGATPIEVEEYQEAGWEVRWGGVPGVQALDGTPPGWRLDVEVASEEAWIESFSADGSTSSALEIPGGGGSQAWQLDLVLFADGRWEVTLFDGGKKTRTLTGGSR